jgi:hypothetical protein
MLEVARRLRAAGSQIGKATRHYWCRLTSHDWQRLGGPDEDEWAKTAVPLEVVKRIEICCRCLSVRYTSEKQGGAHGKTDR